MTEWAICVWHRESEVLGQNAQADGKGIAGGLSEEEKHPPEPIPGDLQHWRAQPWPTEEKGAAQMAARARAQLSRALLEG